MRHDRQNADYDVIAPIVPSWLRMYGVVSDGLEVVAKTPGVKERRSLRRRKCRHQQVDLFRDHLAAISRRWPR